MEEFLKKCKVVHLGPSSEIVDSIISSYLPNAPEEVKKAIADYARGNPGAARVLSERAGNLESAAGVELLVGWPLSEHTQERSGDIWDRFKNG